jgi:NADH-quinone oxidoreductase subunit F
MARLRTLSELESFRKRILSGRDPSKPCITVCAGTGCSASGAERVLNAFGDQIAMQGLQARVDIKRTCCHGFCERGPIVVIHPEKVFYQRVSEGDVAEIIESVANGHVVERLLYVDPSTGRRFVYEDDVPFYKQQQRLIFANNGRIDPTSIEDYVALDGYAALSRVLSTMTPEEVIAEIKQAGLRGRGGAGFPTGVKWEYCHQAPGNPKYVICNGDEGDPGAFMDRSLLEGNPHSVLEGMIIGAYAIGAREGYFYVRNEYPLAVKHVGIAIQQAKECGFLGKNILGSGFDFHVRINRGGGAFVCGEETALIASIEGRSGEPRPRPPYPTESGLWGKPTVINNVKTWANVPLIIEKRADWYRQIGTETSKGTMIFSLVGKINNTGLVEVPMGITLRKMVYEIGGGIPGGKRFKAVQTGGPSGGCIPAPLLDLQVDYEQLTQAGAIMGSGGMVVMDEDTCMVDVARFFLTFTKDESCGKCTPCREGTKRMLEILTDITEGRGKEEDLALLEELATTVKDAALCALGGTAPNPVLTTLRYFRDEYEQHIKYKRCPAMVCKEIIFVPCKYNCPVKTDVPAFIAHIARGEYREAFEIIRAPNPFPISCGYVCHHPCEDRCRSLETGGESLAIKALKRFAGDYVIKSGFKPLPKPKVPRLEKVAIVGSGPAGLAAAFDLACMGYQPTVFEASSVVGGNLAAAIPEFRLPRRILNLEIECIKKAGVKILTNTPVGRDLTFDDLLAQGYKAILLTVGAHKSLKLGLPGENTPGVMDGLDFLKALKLGKKVPLGEKVGVIGGGNAAIDAARTVLRAGAREVSIIYRRTKAEMPAIRREIDAGLEEGVEIVELAAPSRILTRNGRLTGIECLAMELGEYDATGRRRPIPVRHTEFIFPLDNLILAIGEEPDLSWLPTGHGLEISNRNTIVTDLETLATQRPGIFAAGDCVTGPSTIADSIAGGKLAAVSIHKFLRGQPVTREYTVAGPSPYVPPVERTVEEVELQRFPMPFAPVAERVRNFDMVELGLSEEMALKEARRCLRCDLR